MALHIARAEAKRLSGLSARAESRIAEISARYDDLSARYQAHKAQNDIPLR